MKCTYLRNIRNWRPQLIPHNLLTINYMKLTFPVVISSQSKFRFNTFVECREILKEITKKSFGPGCKVKLPLNSYKNTVLPMRAIRARHREMKSVLWESGAMGGGFWKVFFWTGIGWGLQNPALATSKGGTSDSPLTWNTNVRRAPEPPGNSCNISAFRLFIFYAKPPKYRQASKTHTRKNHPGSFLKQILWKSSF